MPHAGSCSLCSKGHIQNLSALCVPSSTLLTQRLAGCSHDIYILLTPDHLDCAAPSSLPGLSAACEQHKVGRKQLVPLSVLKAVPCSIQTQVTPALS